MSAPDPASPGGFVHATALVIGEAGVLIRGASGAGKTSLAVLLLEAAARAGRFARLVGDDRVALAARHGRVVARGHPAVAGLMERRTCGIATVPFEPACVLGLVVDIAADEPRLARLPAAEDGRVAIAGVDLPRLSVQGRPDALMCAAIFEKLSSAF